MKWRSAWVFPAAIFLSGNASALVSALRTHELGHVQNGRDFETALKRTATAASAASCGALDAAMRASFAALLKQANQRDVDYDTQTRHGATQGAYYQ